MIVIKVVRKVNTNLLKNIVRKLLESINTIVLLVGKRNKKLVKIKLKLCLNWLGN